MKRNKWYLIKLKDEKYMVAWNVKDEEEAVASNDQRRVSGYENGYTVCE